ncbi:hypothetical protein M758_5G199300 [Ceratodon purpureus]|uniref:Uncharacterized protein n=1 Tax=Ceratodon purpureus TaxID=3225 RepID=A0A8T0I4T4_CERPU|nr:hypothetical protein KC19_5G205400 [Ceratodon purpureus]KAG0617564.1 hypothetical protein M758_5G199300 [Ceratodon purpureus]
MDQGLRLFSYLSFSFTFEGLSNLEFAQVIWRTEELEGVGFEYLWEPQYATGLIWGAQKFARLEESIIWNPMFVRIIWRAEGL